MSVTTPDPTVDFVGLYADQDEGTILSRMMGWANEGLDPVANGDQWVDTREGGHWRTCITPGVREIARLYDLAGSEVPMSAFVLWAWGDYLDDLAANYDVARKAATVAVGVETFSGPAGSVISVGTAVSTVSTSPDDPAQLFVTTSGGTIPAPITIIGNLNGTTGVVSAIASTAGITVGKPASGVAVPAGATVLSVDSGTQITLVWPGGSTANATGTTIVIGTATVDLSISADAAGSAGNVAAHAITAPSTPLPAGVTVDNAGPTGGGTDEETDDELRGRVLQAMAGKGPGNVADYIRWASAWPGVGAVKVVPTPTGPNSVLVLVTDPNGGPLLAGAVAGLQSDLDPVVGKGEGTAPIGANVNVQTSTALTINVGRGTIAYKAGYSADGAGNTIAVHDDIAAAISLYLLTVPPGGTVRVAHVAGIIATWEGVDNVTGVTLNGSGADIAVGLSPPQAPRLGTLTL